SLAAILENPWVQRSFIVSNKDPPYSLYTDILGETFTYKRLDWEAARYFTLILCSKNLAVANCFRVPFVTKMGRDILVFDVLVSNTSTRTPLRECFRLCTAHLESLWEGIAYRQGQLALISSLLKGDLAMGSKIVAGVAGGDMNVCDSSEHQWHKASSIDLKDAWEDVPTPPIPVLRPFQKDHSFGQAKGNTWGY
ncbi:hypothetical protein B0J12DRAFT_582422, partial [Macrophomina phaseolina]